MTITVNMVGNDRNTPSSQSPQHSFSTLGDLSCHVRFGTVVAWHTSLCNFHQANKGKQWYQLWVRGTSQVRAVSQTFRFTWAHSDLLINGRKAAFVCNLFPEFSLRKHLICMRFPPSHIRRLKSVLTPFWRTLFTFHKYAETRCYHSSVLWYSERTTNHLGC